MFECSVISWFVVITTEKKLIYCVIHDYKRHIPVHKTTIKEICRPKEIQGQIVYANRSSSVTVETNRSEYSFCASGELPI